MNSSEINTLRSPVIKINASDDSKGLQESKEFAPIVYLLPLIIILTYKMLGVGRFLQEFMGGGRGAESGSVFNQLILSGSFLLALLIMLRQPEKTPPILKKNKLLLFFLAYAFLSCLWSPFPTVSLKRWIQFFGVILVAIAAMSGSGGLKGVINTLLWITALGVSISLVGAIVMPGLFVGWGGHWTGVYWDKNALGASCALTLAVWLPVLSEKFKKRTLAMLVIVIALIVLVASSSATALVVSAFVFSIFILLKLPLPMPIKALFAPIPIIIVYLFFLNFMNLSPIEFGLSLIGRSANLTGRDTIWLEMIPFIKQHPVWGIGYNAFWIQGIGDSTLLLQKFYWSFNQAHNGYIDILNELGFVGLAIFIVLLIQTIKRAVSFYKNRPTEGLAFLLIVLSLIINNFTETKFCRQSSVGWLFFLIVIVSMSTGYLKKAERVNP